MNNNRFDPSLVCIFILAICTFFITIIHGNRIKETENNIAELQKQIKELDAPHMKLIWRVDKSNKDDVLKMLSKEFENNPERWTIIKEK